MSYRINALTDEYDFKQNMEDNRTSYRKCVCPLDITFNPAAPLI